MKNKAMEARINHEVLEFLDSRRSLQLATLGEDGAPYASYAPFAADGDCLYVILSEIAIHARNLQWHPTASVLVIEDEDSADELFARRRVNYRVQAELLPYGSEAWHKGMAQLVKRHGERPANLGRHADFKMFRLEPTRGRYVKGFGKAFELAGGGLAAGAVDHLRDGHRARSVA